MNKDLTCDIHNNCHIFHIDVLNNQEKKLKCVQSIANKKQEMSFIYIPKIINLEENMFLDNWPPLSDDLLREKIVKLKHEDNDISQQVIDFYEQFTQEIVNILSNKKKEQLIQIQKFQELKEKIIKQYCKMASLDKISKCFTQENQQTEQIENNLKECMNSQFDRIDEYTSILSQMMRQYELISTMNIQKHTKIKENVLDILKIVNLLPLNTFNFGDEMYSFDQITAYKQIIDQEYDIHSKSNCQIDNLIDQLDLCNQHLIKRMNQKDWYLDDFLQNQKALIIKNFTDQTQFFKDIYLCLFQLKTDIQNNQQICNKSDFKYYNEFLSLFRFKSDIISASNRNNSLYQLSFQIDFKGQLIIQKTKNCQSNCSCYINYILKPKKKYLFKINFYKSNQSSSFYICLIDNMNKDNSFQSYGIGFSICNIGQDSIYRNQDALDSKKIAYTLEFRICIESQVMQYRVCNNNTSFVNCSNKSQIKVNGQYFFALEFQYDYLGDMLEIVDYQELEQFPN
ncbi:hypothetical protein ABPG74_006604 [Tetrahymena malaccensis]